MISPLFEPHVLLTAWPGPLAELPVPSWLAELSHLDAATGLPIPDEASRTAVRDLLRAGGFSPSGRNKPCNEYIRAAAADGRFPIINPPVDLVNALALHSGLPAGILDADLLAPPLHFQVGSPGSTYVFNRAGQALDLTGLLCLFDAAGPCGSPIKDPMRAKTTDSTTRTLTTIWGTRALSGRATAATLWLAARFERLGGVTTRLPVDDHGRLGPFETARNGGRGCG